MKKYIALVISILLISCKHSGSQCDYHIHFQGGFEKTLVEITVDSNVVYKGILTTDFSEGYAGELRLGNALSCNDVVVHIGFGENRVSKKIQLSGKFIGVYLNGDEIKYTVQNKPYHYE